MTLISRKSYANRPRGEEVMVRGANTLRSTATLQSKSVLPYLVRLLCVCVSFLYV